MKPSSFRSLFGIAAERGLYIEQMEIVTTCLYDLMVLRSWYGGAGIAERKRSEGALSTVPEGECWQMRGEVSAASRYSKLHESCMSRSLSNIHLDGSPAVFSLFSLLSPCM